MLVGATAAEDVSVPLPEPELPELIINACNALINAKSAIGQETNAAVAWEFEEADALWQRFNPAAAAQEDLPRPEGLGLRGERHAREFMAQPLGRTHWLWPAAV